MVWRQFCSYMPLFSGSGWDLKFSSNFRMTALIANKKWVKMVQLSRAAGNRLSISVSGHSARKPYTLKGLVASADDEKAVKGYRYGIRRGMVAHYCAVRRKDRKCTTGFIFRTRNWSSYRVKHSDRKMSVQKKTANTAKMSELTLSTEFQSTRSALTPMSGVEIRSQAIAPS